MGRCLSLRLPILSARGPSPLSLGEAAPGPFPITSRRPLHVPGPRLPKIVVAVWSPSMEGAPAPSLPTRSLLSAHLEPGPLVPLGPELLADGGPGRFSTLFAPRPVPPPPFGPVGLYSPGAGSPPRRSGPRGQPLRVPASAQLSAFGRTAAGDGPGRGPSPEVSESRGAVAGAVVAAGGRLAPAPSSVGVGALDGRGRARSMDPVDAAAPGPLAGELGLPMLGVAAQSRPSGLKQYFVAFLAQASAGAPSWPPAGAALRLTLPQPCQKGRGAAPVAGAARRRGLMRRRRRRRRTRHRPRRRRRPLRRLALGRAPPLPKWRRARRTSAG